MTNNKRTIAILSITSILIFSGFGYSPFAYSAGSGFGGDKDWNDFQNFKKWKGGGSDSEPEIESGLCQSQDNLIDNGCFESPNVNTPQDWNIYPKSQALPDWEAVWLDPENACEDFPDLPGQLELQEGILGGPAEGTQHAELDSDCGGPGSNSEGKELTSVAISQNTNVVTSSDDEYTITFAYKARPGKDVPLSTNGLSVSWNDSDITPDLKFSKKDWKYASVTVSGPEISGPSVLRFEDTGNPDTLGTFLDDVSVIKVPKPDVKIILNKEIDNSQADDTDVIIEDPSGFDIRINGQAATLGEDNPNVFQNGGDFSFTEVAPNYVATVEGDNCPEINDVESSVALEPGDVLVCDILNTFVPPPTITLKKVISQDNTDDDDEHLVTPSDFSMYITNVGPDGMPGTGDEPARQLIDEANKEVSPGTYTLSEEYTGPEDFEYEFVLIAGDTDCPTMVEDMEVFTLESGQHLTCVIYNDDDADDKAGEPADGPGVIFHFDTVNFHVFGEFEDPPLGPNAGICSENGDDDADFYLPCVEPIGDNFYVVPNIDPSAPQQLTRTSLIMLTVTNTETPSANSGCTVSGIAKETMTTNRMAFFFDCTSFNESEDHNANFALIETCMLDIDENGFCVELPDP